MPYNPDDSIQKTSKLNSAWNQLKRLDGLWELVNQQARADNFASWNTNLDRVWMELGADLEEGDDREIKFLKINSELIKTGILNDSKFVGFKRVQVDNLEVINKQRELLRIKEMFLRRLQNSLGKGTAWVDPDEDMIE